MRKIKVVVLLVRQLQHYFTKNAKVSPNLTVTQYHISMYYLPEDDCLKDFGHVSKCRPATYYLVLLTFSHSCITGNTLYLVLSCRSASLSVTWEYPVITDSTQRPLHVSSLMADRFTSTPVRFVGRFQCIIIPLHRIYMHQWWMNWGTAGLTKPCSLQQDSIIENQARLTSPLSQW